MTLNATLTPLAAMLFHRGMRKPCFLRWTLAAVVSLNACAGTAPPSATVSKAPALLPTCLALSVGGPAGVAHLGALESLRAHNVDVSCVVGNSMGSLIGALYASNPRGDTTNEFRSLMQEYVAATKQEAGGRALGGALIGLAILGPLGALVTGSAAASSVDRMNHARLIAVLDNHLSGVAIEALPVPYATSYVEQKGGKAQFVEVSSGNVADAVGGSIANPFIFDELDVRAGGRIDPGIDRVAAVPIEQTCSSFPNHRVLAVNVMEQESIVSRSMQCPFVEVRVAAPSVAPEAVLADPSAFANMVAVGREAMDSWFTTQEGQDFLAIARRTSRSECVAVAGTNGAQQLVASGPREYEIQVVSAVLGPTKPSGNAWDGAGDGPADVSVTVEVAREGNITFTTPIARNTLSPTWQFVHKMQIAEGDFLDVAVWDMDALFNDHIFSGSIPFTGPQRYVIREPAQALNELVIEIREVPDGVTAR